MHRIPRAHIAIPGTCVRSLERRFVIPAQHGYIKRHDSLRRYPDSGDNDRRVHLSIGAFVPTVFATYTNYRAFRSAYTGK